jgi:hypothetical protein
LVITQSTWEVQLRSYPEDLPFIFMFVACILWPKGWVNDGKIQYRAVLICETCSLAAWKFPHATFPAYSFWFAKQKNLPS